MTTQNIEFITSGEKVEASRKELFLVLDSGDYSYFLEVCEDLTLDTIVNARDRRIGYEGRTLLHNAVRIQHCLQNSIVDLVKKGCNVNAVDSSVSLVTPLMDAVAVNAINKAIFLVENDAILSKQVKI
jgi:hypothetical protein